MIGKKVNHYEITARIGAGGMGEVFKATDTRLDREVALKFLPESFASDSERLQRFDREAKLLAGLNHPNIAAIYGIERDGDQRFLVLELVPGEDLAVRLSRGPVPVEDALKIAYQVAEALEAAHDQGVVHRDLKPGNIVVTPDGVVKVLDFGLAKAFEANADSSALSHSPTILASSPTVQGVILGTAGYMSPEQARGKPVDRRADVWAFGCVLLEMLTGRQVFGGETVSDTLASVLKTEPGWDNLPGDTPVPVRRLLERCLDKDSRQRLRDIGEARILLDRVIHGDIEEPARDETAASRSTTRRTRVVWLAASFAVAALVGLSAWTLKPDAPDVPLRKFSLAIERGENTGPDDPVISPDGKSVAYVMNGELWVQALDELKPRRLEINDEVMVPFWSPDSKYLGYISKGKLWKVPVDGGASVKLCEPKSAFAGGRGAVWGPDGKIIYSHGSDGLWEVNDQGGDPTEFYPVNSETHGDYHEPSVLPGGRGVLYVGHRKNGSPDTIELWTNGERRELVQVPKQRLWSPQYAPSGHIVYRRSGANGGVWAVPFSLSKLEVTGEPFLVAAEAVDPTVASDGTLVYLRGESESEVYWRWVGRGGVVGDSISVPIREYAEPALSPDGTHMAVTEYDGEEVDIWIHDLSRHTRTRFTFAEGEQVQPCWSPDGKYIYYADLDRDSVLVRAADGTGSPRLVAVGEDPDITTDGRYLVTTSRGRETLRDIWITDLDGDGESRAFLATPAREGLADVSPDGRYIAYTSDESGTGEVYIKKFPGGEGKWQVSTEGGIHPIWSRDGGALFYRQGTCDLVEVPVDTQSDLQLGTPRLVVDCSELQLTSFFYRCYTVSPDGSQFLMLQPVRPNLNTIDVGVTVVQNWVSEFTH